MSALISTLRRLCHVPAAPVKTPDPYEAFVWSHGDNPLEWDRDLKAEYLGYVHAYEFLARAAQQRKTGGRR